jgi:hypothetical protein
MLVASWIDDQSRPELEMENRKVFYMNETLLLHQHVFAHFNQKHEKKFHA